METATDTRQQTHTPGPWATGSTITRVEVWPKGWNAPLCVADCHAKNAPDTKAERIANARLIAACPDLYAACQAFIARAEQYDAGNFLPTVDLVRAALAKARGEA